MAHCLDSFQATVPVVALLLVARLNSTREHMVKQSFAHLDSQEEGEKGGDQGFSEGHVSSELLLQISSTTSQYCHHLRVKLVQMSFGARRGHLKFNW